MRTTFLPLLLVADYHPADENLDCPPLTNPTSGIFRSAQHPWKNLSVPDLEQDLEQPEAKSVCRLGLPRWSRLTKWDREHD